MTSVVHSIQNNANLKLLRLVKITSLSCRYNHLDVVKDQTDNLASYKRGKGGRGSFSGIVATVFGSSGFMGRYVVNRLGKIGSQVILPYRGDAYIMRDLKLAGELGQILFQPFHLRDEDSIRQSLKYSNVVINLIGRDWETKNFTYEDVHIHGPRLIARLAREMGVQRFIQMSHICAQPNPPTIYNQKEGSKYLRTKYEGELAVKEEFPTATIIRCADIFGEEDRLLNYYATIWRRTYGRFPVYKKGEETIKRPLYIFNAAEGILSAVQNDSSAGHTYEFFGPNAYYLSDLMDYFFRCLREPYYKRVNLTPFFIWRSKLFELVPERPILTYDKVLREHVSENIEGHMTLEDLGVTTNCIEDKAEYMLKPYLRHAYYQEEVGEFSTPLPPPVAAI